MLNSSPAAEAAEQLVNTSALLIGSCVVWTSLSIGGSTSPPLAGRRRSRRLILDGFSSGFAPCGARPDSVCACTHYLVFKEPAFASAALRLASRCASDGQAQLLLARPAEAPQDPGAKAAVFPFSRPALSRRPSSGEPSKVTKTSSRCQPLTRPARAAQPPARRPACGEPTSWGRADRADWLARAKKIAPANWSNWVRRYQSPGHAHVVSINIRARNAGVNPDRHPTPRHRTAWRSVRYGRSGHSSTAARDSPALPF